jgi:hypothetical protein
MKNYATLSLPFQIKLDSFNPETVILDENLYWPFAVLDPKECLTREAIDFFSNLIGADIMCQLHKGLPGRKQPIHIDGRVHPDGVMRCPREWAVNISWGSSSSEMFWYKPANSTKEETHEICNYSNLYPGYTPGWSDKDLVEIEHHELSGPTLINISIPHHVKNYDMQLRWAITIRAKNGELTYEESYELFKPYML